MLKESKSSAERKAVWEASKGFGFVLLSVVCNTIFMSFFVVSCGFGGEERFGGPCQVMTDLYCTFFHCANCVRMRNNAAQKLGFSNYHVMQLHLSEQSQSQVLMAHVQILLQR